jgi:hypothetical protein
MADSQLSGYRLEQTGRGWVASLDKPKLAVRAETADLALDGLRDLTALVRRLATGDRTLRAQSSDG